MENERRASRRASCARCKPDAPSKCCLGVNPSQPALHIPSSLMAVQADLASKTSSVTRVKHTQDVLPLSPRFCAALGLIPDLHTRQTQTQQQIYPCLLDSLAIVVLRNHKRVLCHDDNAGKRVWSEVNSLLVDLTFTLFFLDYSHTLSVHTLAKPSLEFEKPGTQGYS